MRVKGATVQRLMLGAALMAALAWNLSHAAEVEAVRLGTGATGTRAEIALDAPGEFKALRLKSPDRLAIDLPASRLARDLKLPAGSGVIGAVRSGEPAPGAVRIVFDLTQPVAAMEPRIERGAEGVRIVIEWPGDGDAPAPVAARPVAKPAGAVADPARSSADATSRLIAELKAAGAVTSAAPAAGTAERPGTAASGPVPAAAVPTSTSSVSGGVSSSTGVPGAVGAPTTTTTAASNAIATKPAAAPAGDAAPPSRTGASSTTVATDAGLPPLPATGVRSMRPLVIAIDPGHGGQDPGALGPGGSREKDVTLAIARELARQINATPGLKAYLTRDTDVFLPLPRRAQLAKQARADMFVSIHADAAENRAARGSSVFVLSLKGASSQRARWLADKENASDIIGGVRLGQGSGTLASVLLDLTQSGHMRASEDAASHVLSGLRRLGPNHKPHVERANFAVLRTADMPSMLVETAFISNPEEEKRLTDPVHQRALARAVLDGVNTYFTRQPPPGTMYAARAETQSRAGAGGGSP